MSIFSTTSRKPIKRHPPRRKPGDVDRQFIAWVKTLPCCVRECCRDHGERWRWAQVEAHHAGAHGFAQRAPDRTCIPLCAFHHREGSESIHKLGKHFRAHHGLNRDELIRKLNEAYDAIPR